MTRPRDAAAGTRPEEWADFHSWFVAQMGPRPSNALLVDLRENAEALEHAAATARTLYWQTREWERMETAARYAFNAATPARGKGRRKK